jgi:DnaJ-class molecular chaperone
MSPRCTSCGGEGVVKALACPGGATVSMDCHRCQGKGFLTAERLGACLG